MSISAKTNRLTGPAVTGASATTDPGFQPKGLFMWSGLQTTGGAVADAQFSIGVAASTTTENSAGYNSDDNVAAGDSTRFYNSGRFLVNYTSGTNTVNNIVDLNSLDATGFTPGWTTLTTANPLYNYLAIGGADITNVKTGNFAMDAVTGAGGTQDVTGMGFQPDIVFFFGTLQATSGASNNNSQFYIGTANASGQWVTAQRTQNAAATMNTTRAFKNDKCILIQSSTTNAVFDERSFNSMLPDGFRLNIDVQGATACLVGYMAVKGGQWKVGTETQKTSTGTKATTGTGFTPKVLLLGSACDVQTSGTEDHARLAFGASTGASNNVCLWTGDRDNVPDSIANTIMSNSKCIVMATEGTIATPTTQAEAALSSFDSDGFTLDWTTADATARVFGYVAGGDNAGGAAVSTSNFFQFF